MTQSYKKIPAFVLGLYTDVREVLFETAYRVKERLSQEGKPVRYPIDWDSPKQMRAYYATNGFGAGIPYRRTHAMRLGIKIERVPLGTNLRIPHPGGAVLGLPGTPSGWQSRIHRNRWPYLLEVLFDELGKIPQAIQGRFSVRSRE
jgi:hypothetical protein